MKKMKVQALVVATIDRLYATDGLTENVDAETDQHERLPAHVYMSDQYRQTQPPKFANWQQTFRYFRVSGTSMLPNDSDEHIQWIEPRHPVVSDISRCASYDTGDLCIRGHACSETPCRGSSQTLPEVNIAVDGIIEEWIAHDANDCNDDYHNESKDELRDACLSPRSSRTEELLSELTLQCVADAPAVLLGEFAKELAGRHQAGLRAQRLAREHAARTAQELALAEEERQRLRQEQEQAELEARALAMLRAREEEERREREQQELLIKQQLEENDEEEIKIRTLAYSHTREWYQPNKKCFSHRGRQL
ncbi:TPA: hypothetical protein N0F65_008794 [Lagenidium giganteum]|uniref:Uncharacterized protein n=1 Tax=Lagenidium giganteum TaxID=4803 RepID=A0AAV2YZ77_9STRA|nr:TPA: hypothetical protein N0F65_008794 [Lagenidium giganteum]